MRTPLRTLRGERPAFVGRVALALALGASPSRTARAEEPPLVLLELDRCDELDETEVRRITSAELGARAANIGGDNVTQVTVSCQQSRVKIQVVDPLSRKSVSRTFDIGLSGPKARSRLVAIAATELVLASWTELETNPKPNVEPTGAAPSPSAAQAAREIAKEKMEKHYEPKPRAWYDLDRPSERMFRVVALGSARAFFTHAGALAGGGLRFGEEPFKYFSWSADVLLESGELHSTETNYRVTTSTIGGTLFAYVRSGVFTARAGAGLRVGLAGSTPTAQFPGTSSLAPWGWPLGALSFSLRGGSAVFELSGESGYVVLPVRGGGTNMSGGWFSAQFGIGFVLGPRTHEDRAGEAGE